MTRVDLYDYGAREYDHTIGRFMQPDSASPDPPDPQSLNSYSYVLNNPLRYVDPTGHWVAPWWNPTQCYAHLNHASYRRLA
jgi:RHS repeat-associated protein